MQRLWLQGTGTGEAEESSSEVEAAWDFVLCAPHALKTVPFTPTQKQSHAQQINAEWVEFAIDIAFSFNAAQK